MHNVHMQMRKSKRHEIPSKKVEKFIVEMHEIYEVKLTGSFLSTDSYTSSSRNHEIIEYWKHPYV